MPEIDLRSFRGGMNDSDPAISLPDDQVVLAQNVECWRSTLGERRRGGTAIDLTGSDLAACDRIVWMHRHLPTSDPADAQLWAMGIDGSTPVLAYKDTSWHTVTMGDAPTVDAVSEYQIDAVSLHGKLFLFYNSSVDRLHVFDTRTSTTALRRVGMAALSTAPTAADSGSGSFDTTRYYRTRETVQVGGTTILRSEPSNVLTKSPSGSGSGLTVTKPSTVNSDPAATHWELEASLNNADFYVIATTAIGTTTATDTTAAATGYGAFDLSEEIGDYTPPHSAKHGIADEDRLVIFGAWEDTDLQSSMSWTQVFNATGVGNDERITLDPVSVLNLDGFEGGAITDVGRWAAGSIGAFKESHVYKIIRTGNRTRAYEAFAESKEIGALPGSVVEGIDESGNAALYFLDQSVGPYRFTVRGGLQVCGSDVRETWSGVNVDATKVPARGFYYRTAKQVHWRVPTGSDNVPTIGLVIQTNEMRLTPGGEARRGFAKWTGPSCAALACCLFSDNIDADTDRSRTLVPFIGLEGGGLIWRMDTGDDDNGTEYTARITSKPYAPAGLQTQFEIRSATLVAKATADASLTIAVMPDFGLTPSDESAEVSLTPVGSETAVIRHLDDLHLSELKTVQVDIEDLATPGARWELARLTLTDSPGQGA